MIAWMIFDKDVGIYVGAGLSRFPKLWKTEAHAKAAISCWLRSIHPKHVDQRRSELRIVKVEVREIK
jgi:hypothetical protein